jgi:hypothetical protein
MEVPEASLAAPSAPPAERSLSPFARAVAIFTNPTGAWDGLATRTQWWFPLIIMTLLGVAFTAVLHERAVMPTITEQWEKMVEDGKMTQDQLDKMEQRMSGPAGVAMSAVPQVIAWPVIMLILAAGVSFAVSFMVGAKLRFRHAFEVVTWSSLIQIPEQVIGAVLAWTRETMRGIHLGLGILVPQSEPPEKWQSGLASFLDAFGPFEIWALAVVIIGASTLAGAPRKPVAWVIIGLFLALRILLAATGALFSPGG